MSTALAVTTQEPDPQLPLLSDAIVVDPKAEAQREVQANLQNSIDLTLAAITNLELREISQTILANSSASSIGSTASRTIFTNSTRSSRVFRSSKSSSSRPARWSITSMPKH